MRKPRGRDDRPCVDTGINFLDTANVYNSGESEEMLGGYWKAAARISF